MTVSCQFQAEVQTVLLIPVTDKCLGMEESLLFKKVGCKGSSVRDEEVHRVRLSHVWVLDRKEVRQVQEGSIQRSQWN